jgi:hypothetical protein
MQLLMLMKNLKVMIRLIASYFRLHIFQRFHSNLLITMVELEFTDSVYQYFTMYDEIAYIY